MSFSSTPLSAKPPFVSASGQRRPRSAYRGSNGFAEESSIGEKRTLEPGQEWQAAKRHRFAQFVLEEKGGYFPSLDTMQETTPPTKSAHAKAQIKALQEEHERTSDALYEHNAREYLNDALDLYLARDNSQYLEKDERDPKLVESYRELEKLYKTTRRPTHNAPYLTSHNRLSTLHHTHHLTLLPLHTHHRTLLRRESEAQRRRDAQFPNSVEEYRQIKNADTKLRVARFLALSAPDSKREKGEVVKEQDEMLGRFGWAWRQVKPLCDEVAKNESFQQEIFDHLRTVQTVFDPRQRPTTSGAA